MDLHSAISQKFRHASGVVVTQDKQATRHAGINEHGHQTSTVFGSVLQQSFFYLHSIENDLICFDNIGQVARCKTNCYFMQ
jgi:type II secretory pathway component PulC